MIRQGRRCLKLLNYGDNILSKTQFIKTVQTVSYLIRLMMKKKMSHASHILEVEMLIYFFQDSYQDTFAKTFRTKSPHHLLYLNTCYKQPLLEAQSIIKIMAHLELRWVAHNLTICMFWSASSAPWMSTKNKMTNRPKLQRGHFDIMTRGNFDSWGQDSNN